MNATFSNGTYIAKQYTVLAASSVSGTFGKLDTYNLPTNFSDSLSYGVSHAYFNLSPSYAPSPAAPTAPNFGNGLSSNQNSVGNALIKYFNTTGGIPALYGTLTPTGLTQAEGTRATGSQQATFDAMNLFMGLLTGPFMKREERGGTDFSVNGSGSGRSDLIQARGLCTPHTRTDLCLRHFGLRLAKHHHRPNGNGCRR